MTHDHLPSLLAGSPRHPCRVGDHCLIGPHAHVTGATIEEQVFIATGASIFHGAHVGKGAVIRVDGIVHLKARLEPGAVVPIKWIALGDPVQLFPPEKHEELSVVLRALNFSMTVYGVDPATPDRMAEVTCRLSDALGAHRGDIIQG